MISSHSLLSKFPTKDEAVAQILHLIDTKKRPSDTVYLESDALGSEQILMSVAKRYKVSLGLLLSFSTLSLHFEQKTQIYVQNEKRRAELRLVKPFERLVTDDQTATQFHVVPFMTLTSVAHGIQMPRIQTVPDRREGGLFIKGSVQYFFRGGYNESMKIHQPMETSSGVWHVLYSMHSSYNELRRFVAHLNPVRIIPLTADCDGTALRMLTSKKKSKPNDEN